MSRNRGSADRVIIVTDELARGGGSPRSQFELAGGLRRLGLEIDLAYLREGRMLDAWSRVADRRLRVGYRPPFAGGRSAERRRLVANALSAVTAALRLGPRRREVVLARGHEEIFTAAVVARLRRAPLVVHLCSPPPPKRPVAAFAPADRFGYRTAARFIAVAHHLADAWTVSGIPRGAIEAIHTGLDVDHWRAVGDDAGRFLRATLGIAPTAFVVLYAGRFHASKGLLVLAQALAGRDRGPKAATLVAVGLGEAARGDESTLVAAVREAAPGGHVHLVPAVDDLRPWYAAADVVAVPSLWPEPFSRVALEALACERPVVASDVGGSREFLTGEFSAWRHPPGSAAELGARLERLRDWRSTDPALGRRCRTLVTSHFTLERSGAAVAAVLSRVLETHAWWKPPRGGRETRRLHGSAHGSDVTGRNAATTSRMRRRKSSE